MAFLSTTARSNARAFLSKMKNKYKPKAESTSATPAAIPDGAPYSATTPEQFLALTKECEDRVQQMLMHNENGSMLHLKINNKQCKYVAAKLKMAVQKAEMFIISHLQGSSISEEENKNCLYEFRLLHTVACAVKNFIQNCCKEAWVAAAFLMPNMSHDVLSLIFDLALLEYILSGHYMEFEVEGVYRDEASVVAEKAAADSRLLVSDVKALLRTEEKTSVEYQLATLLLRRLETPGECRTDIESLTEKKVIVKGPSANLYRAKWLGMDVALKTFKAVKTDHGSSSLQEFPSEVSIVGCLSHPNLASVFGYAEDKWECSIVMELMDCDLCEFIREFTKEHPFSIIEAVNIMLEVGKGVEYLHEMKIVHRDLKAANILVKKLGNCREGESRSILIKVADFGLSKTKEKSMTYSMQTFNTGTPRWMAPEVIHMRRNEGQEEDSRDTKVLKYPRQSDVFSYGMVCYEILTGRLPYDEVHLSSQIMEKILSGDRPELPKHCFAELKDLIKRCWSQDASKRPRFREICEELRSIRFQLLLSDMQQRIGPQVAIKLPGEAQIVVGLDIGTTFSRYAFAHKSKPKEILTFEAWPESTKPFCKTPTAIYYEPGAATTAKVKSWGWEAVRARLQDIDRISKLRTKSEVDLRKFGTFCWEFIPCWDLTGPEGEFFEVLLSESSRPIFTRRVPVGFTESQVIADYLREIGASIMRHLRTKFTDDITMADVQWCVTLTSNWKDDEKKQMQVCMARSGLVRSAYSPGGSPHPVSIVLEAEAASCYCHRNMPNLELKVGDRLLVAYGGGVTSDIVVQEWIGETPDDYRVKEVTKSLVFRGGGMDVDMNFFWKSLNDKEFFDELFFEGDPNRKFEKVGNWEMSKQWEEIKCSFGDRVSIGKSFKIQVPRVLAAKWEEFHKKHGKQPRSSYDELELTHADIEAIFEPLVTLVLDRIADEISRTANVKVILVVGGFGGSPYVLTKIKERFLGTVEKVMSPVQPGSAVCQGAVMLALNPGGS